MKHFYFNQSSQTQDDNLRSSEYLVQQIPERKIYSSEKKEILMHNLADKEEDGITDKTIEEVNQCALPTENPTENQVAAIKW